MPIGDLLASISGETPKRPPLLSKATSPAPKRKAEDELKGSVVKTSRTAPLTDSPSRIPAGSAKPIPRPSDRPSSKLSSTPGLTSQSSAGLPNGASNRPAVTPSRLGPNRSTGNGDKLLSTKPVVRRQVTASSAPPKKRSYAEIMARAEAAQGMRSSAFGKIQHKTIVPGMSRKERRDLMAEEGHKATKTSKQTPQKQGRPNTPVRNGINGVEQRNGKGINGSSKPPGTAKGKRKAVVEEEKKVKKAALATTGYAGTARPRPSEAKPGSGPAASRPASDANARERPRYGGVLSGPRRRRDDYEDEMDDFIEYDDDEEEPGYGRRGGYDSAEEDESDMEAGLSDIDQEERRAEFVGRREDQEQEALERKLKREKEERKRHYLASGRR